MWKNPQKYAKITQYINIYWLNKIWWYHAFFEDKHTFNHIFIYYRTLKDNSNSLKVSYHHCTHKRSWMFNIPNNMDAIFVEEKCKQQCLWGKISLYGGYFWKICLGSCTSGCCYEKSLSKTSYCAKWKS